eukprot:1775545-Pyramimonas_sp.AAC.1
MVGTVVESVGVWVAKCVGSRQALRWIKAKGRERFAALPGAHRGLRGAPAWDMLSSCPITASWYIQIIFAFL